jgi:hypothetical protein
VRVTERAALREQTVCVGYFLRVRHSLLCATAQGRAGAVRTIRAHLSDMDNLRKPGGAPIGSRQGGAPEATKETSLNETGRAHHTRTERGALTQNPNLNQAGNERGSQDQTDGLQTGNDVDE